MTAFTIDDIITLAKIMPKRAISSAWVDSMDTLKPLFDFPGGWAGSFTSTSLFPLTCDLRGIPVHVDPEMSPRSFEFRDQDGRVLKDGTVG